MQKWCKIDYHCAIVLFIYHINPIHDFQVHRCDNGTEGSVPVGHGSVDWAQCLIGRQTERRRPLLFSSPPPPPRVSVRLSLWQPHRRQKGSVCVCLGGWRTSDK